ncbi:MAG TPA: hypothetical protein VMZ51_03035 [Acidimicrobiales bacterium]|nr:hypothetical protein [Acidimicrobiales bacterium]
MDPQRTSSRLVRRTIAVLTMLLAAACTSKAPKIEPDPTDASRSKQSDREILLTKGDVSPPPSEVFCGNRPKRPQGSPCATGSVPTAKAKEHVEIRGTVTGIQGYFDSDANREEINEEFLVTVLLDHGWKPADPDQAAVTTLADIDTWTTPYNANTWAPDSLLRPDGAIWGGPEAMVIHVEVDGWLPSGRMCRTKAADGSCAEPGPAPVSWKESRGMPGAVRWAFDPEFPPSQAAACCKLRVGSYLRLVGTMWEDEVHEFGLGPVVGAAHSCWNEGTTTGRGWMEMHPVDYMALLDKPPPAKDALETLVACERPGPGPAGNATSFGKDIIVPGTPPGGAKVACEYRVDPDFTDESSVVEQLITKLPNGVHVEVKLKREQSSAKFKATYHVSWSKDATSSAEECQKL